MSDIAVDARGNRVHIDNADRTAEYFCPVCGERMMQKKGAIRINHFAHFSTTNCRESWSSEEGDWHRSWKNRFPVDCQEIVIKDEEHIHRADVIVNNAVIEFQHSPISEEDFSARNSFYQKHGYQIVWVFDCIDKIDPETIKESVFAYSVPWPTVSNPVPASVRDLRPEAKEKIFVQADENTLYEILESASYEVNFIGKKFTVDEFVTKAKQSGIADDLSFFTKMRTMTEEAKNNAKIMEENVDLIQESFETQYYRARSLEGANTFLDKQNDELKQELEKKTADVREKDRLMKEKDQLIQKLKDELALSKENTEKAKEIIIVDGEVRDLKSELSMTKIHCNFLQDMNEQANKTIERYRKHVLKMLNKTHDCYALLSDFADDDDFITVGDSNGNIFAIDVITGNTVGKY